MNILQGMRGLWVAVTGVILFCGGSISVRGAERQNPFDFSISAPATWTHVNASVVEDSNKSLPEGQLKELLKGARPVVTILRHPPEKHTGQNPSVMLFILENPKLSPATLLETSISAMKSQLGDFKIEKAIHPVAIGDAQGSSVVVAFSRPNGQGGTMEVLSQVRVYRKGRFLYTLGTSGPQNPPKDLQRDFETIVASFRFTEENP